jgi:hypothetical protein
MDPIGRKLNPEEQAVLTVLLQEGRDTHDCTAAGVALALERDPIDVAAVLNRLEGDGLASSAVDAQGDECWSASGSAAEAL